MNILSLLKKDLIKYVPSGNYIQILKTALLSHAFHLVFLIRVGQFFRSIPFVGSFFGIFIEYFIRVVFSSDISCKAHIGGGLMIVHGHDVVIGSNVVMGENCKIFNGVTLGNKDTEVSNNDQPKIGNNVVLGTGTKVLGGVLIGNGVKTGANSVILIDVPDNCVAVGVPAVSLVRK